MWNSLTINIVNCTSVSMFKIHLLTLTQFASKIYSTNAMFYNKVLKGHNGRLFVQFRLGLSPLQSELFTYNISDNPFCPSCGDYPETLSHYLFDCHVYSTQRALLLKELNDLSNAVNTDFHVALDITAFNTIIDLLIHGRPIIIPGADCDIQFNVNLQIYL